MKATSVVLALGLSVVSLTTSALTPQPTNRGGDDNPCAVVGCKPQNDVTSNFQGGSNNCGITNVSVVKGPVQGVNKDGACNCYEGDCKEVTGATCRASCVFTAIVTGGSGYIFCHADDEAWQTTTSTATITLDSGAKDCRNGGAASATGNLYVQCGTNCGSLASGSSAWVVTVRSQCYGCPAWNSDC